MAVWQGLAYLAADSLNVCSILGSSERQFSSVPPTHTAHVSTEASPDAYS